MTPTKLIVSIQSLIEGAGVKFRFTYEGPLPCNPRAGEVVSIKMAIRKALHPQFSDLCSRIPELADLILDVRGKAGINSIRHFYGAPDLSEIGKNHRLNKFEFVPLVIGSIHAVCHLDILFLRREKPGQLISKPKDEYGGDLDNRLKIFFDALRMPHELNEIPKKATPEPSEQPFYCLLQDDSLITKFQVESDTLLGPPTTDNRKDVKIVVQATMSITKYAGWNKQFLV